MLDNETVEYCLERLKEGHGMNFQSKENRDQVYRALKASNRYFMKVRRTSIRNQLYDPRYTVEGRDIPDRGFANDYKHYFAVLYELEPERIW